MSLTVTDSYGPAPYADRWINAKTVAFDSSYAVGGEALTVEQLGFTDTPDLVRAYAQGDYQFTWANELLVARWNRLGLAAVTVGVKDDDNAAATGVAVYVHIDEVVEQGTVLGHLEAVTAGNADSYFAPWNGGPKVPVQDDDAAATGGFALFFDENDTAGVRFSIDSDRFAGTDTDGEVLILLADGSYLKIKSQDNPGGEAGTVQVYFDDDAANDYQRLLFVSPTNANGSDRLWVSGGEVPNGTDLSALTAVLVEAIGLRV